MLMAVVLPAPFGPSRTVIWPFSTCRSSEVGAGFDPNRLATPERATTASAAVRIAATVGALDEVNEDISMGSAPGDVPLRHPRRTAASWLGSNACLSSAWIRSEAHTSGLQSTMRISYVGLQLKTKNMEL